MIRRLLLGITIFSFSLLFIQCNNSRNDDFLEEVDTKNYPKTLVGKSYYKYFSNEEIYSLTRTNEISQLQIKITFEEHNSLSIEAYVAASRNYGGSGNRYSSGYYDYDPKTGKIIMEYNANFYGIDLKDEGIITEEALIIQNGLTRVKLDRYN